jgi:H+/gluconate symporter-like permease
MSDTTKLRLIQLNYICVFIVAMTILLIGTNLWGHCSFELHYLGRPLMLLGLAMMMALMIFRYVTWQDVEDLADRVEKSKTKG